MTTTVETYYENTGKLQCKYTLDKNGLKCDTEYKYDEAGNLMYTCEYKDGNKHGMFYSWYDTGKKHDEGSYELGRYHGKWTSWYTSGNVQYECNRDQGMIQGRHVRRYENGLLWCETYYKNGTFHGTLTCYSSSGNIFSQSNYIDGTLNGYKRNYHDSGTLWMESEYVLGNQDGLERVWTSAGVLIKESEYVANKLHGKMCKYSGTGRLECTLIYNDGELLQIENAYDSLGRNLVLDAGKTDAWWIGRLSDNASASSLGNASASPTGKKIFVKVEIDADTRRVTDNISSPGLYSRVEKCRIVEITDAENNSYTQCVRYDTTYSVGDTMHPTTFTDTILEKYLTDVGIIVFKYRC